MYDGEARVKTETEGVWVTGDATLTQQQQQKRLRRILFEELTHYLHTAAVLDGIRGSELERYV